MCPFVRLLENLKRLRCTGFVLRASMRAASVALEGRQFTDGGKRSVTPGYCRHTQRVPREQSPPREAATPSSN